MSKKKGKGPTSDYLYIDPPKGGGCSFCLLNLSLMLAAPTAVVALIVKGAQR